MLDVGLLATGLAMWLVVNAAARWAPVAAWGRGDVMDRLYLPVVVGILAGRAVAVTLDDPASLRSFRAFLVVRGGVEFWPGVAAVGGLIVLGARRRHEPAVRVLEDLAPFLLWGYAVYEAGCLVRDGCYGPASPIGLTPPGLRTTMFPVGLVVAVACVGLGLGIRRLDEELAARRLLFAIGGLALVRSVASIWLPHLGDRLTRQHTQSLAVLGVVVVVLLARHLTARWRVDPTGGAPVLRVIEGGRGTPR